MTIMINKEKAYDKIIYLFRIKTFNKLGWEGNFLSSEKGIYPKTNRQTNNPVASITITANISNFSLAIRNKTRMAAITLPHCIGGPSHSSKVKKASKKGYENGNKKSKTVSICRYDYVHRKSNI